MAKYPIASYSDLGLAKDYLDEIDRPVGTHYGYDTKTKEVFNSFAFETRNMKRNPTATRPGRSRTKLVSNGERKSNPKKRIIVADIAGTSVPEYKAAYSVHLADRPSFHAMSYFTRKADAVETAKISLIELD